MCTVRRDGTRRSTANGVGVGDTRATSRLSATAAQFVVGEICEPAALGESPYGLFREPSERARHQHAHDTANDHAADLVLRSAVPLRLGVRLQTVLEATGISAASFSRRDGSIADFERLLVERTGRKLIDGFRDEFFDGLLRLVADGPMSVFET